MRIIGKVYIYIEKILLTKTYDIPRLIYYSNCTGFSCEIKERRKKFMIC